MHPSKLLLVATALTLTSCSTPKKISQSTPPLPTVAPAGTPYVTEISFAKNKSVLRYAEQKRIDEALETAKIDAQPGKVIVIAWSDQETPSRTKEQIQLAHDRAWIVKKIIQEKYASLPIETVNLATQPQRLEELMSETETKKALEFAGVQQQDKASKTIVMVIPKKSSK